MELDNIVSLESDLSDLNSIYRELEAFSELLVCHFAYLRDLDQEQNFLKSLNSFSKENSIDLKLVFLSSAAVYGEVEQGFACEDDALQPLSAYGEYKKSLEEFIVNIFSKFLIVRFANPYGKEFTKVGVYRHFFEALEQQIQSGEERLSLNINAEKEAEIIRDFVYIDEFSEKFLNFISQNDLIGIINLSSGQAKSLEDFAKEIISNEFKEHSNKKLEFSYRGYAEGDIKRSVLSTSKQS